MTYLKQLSLFVAAFLLMSSSTQSAWEGAPEDVGLMAELPKNASFRIILDFGQPYPTRSFWPNFGRMQPSHHNGIDFFTNLIRVGDGAKVVSASVGKVIAVGIDKCSGGFVRVSAPERVNVQYVHIERIVVKVGQMLNHGDLIGYIMPKPDKARQPCTGGFPHLHFSLFRGTDPEDQSINPNLYWNDGPGKLSCLEEGQQFEIEKLILTSPLPCLSVGAQADLMEDQPKVVGTFLSLRKSMRDGNDELTRMWQIYLKQSGFYMGVVDGKFGPQTELALRECILVKVCSAN